MASDGGRTVTASSSPGGRAAAGRSGTGLRTVLSGLTTRGRSFLAAGVAAGVCAYVLGQSDLLRVGLFLAALPLGCVIALYRTRYRVAGTRSLSPTRVHAGSEARVHLRLHNVSRLPTGLLMLQDRVPYVLGPRPRFVLDRVEAGGSREVFYRVRSDLRGRYPLGPLQLRLTDPFGMCELNRSFSAHDTLTVVPRIEELPRIRLSGEAQGYGDGRRRALALAGEDDVIPRGYRHGDDLRRIHWRSTARYGELMVRREERPQQSRCTVLLDTRRTAHPGSGPDSAFEWAVSGAASVAVHLLRQGFTVRILTDTGFCVPGTDGSAFGGPGGDCSEAVGMVLDTLAVTEFSDGVGLATVQEALRATDEGLIVAFLGFLAEEDAAVVARMRGRAAAAVAFVPDGTWSQDGAGEAGPEEHAERLRRLRDAGWTALPVAPGARMAELWREAERHRSRVGTGAGAWSEGGA